jgi:hypothetical protein
MSDKRTPYEYKPYPRMLYLRGRPSAPGAEAVIVQDAKEEAAKRAEGYCKLGETPKEPAKTPPANPSSPPPASNGKPADAPKPTA